MDVELLERLVRGANAEDRAGEPAELATHLEAA
jgi:hypothetical protein